MLILLNFAKGSLQDELDGFFKALGGDDVASRFVTAAALCKARKKLSHLVFIHLTRFLTGFLDKRGYMRTWRNRRLFAIDGTTLTLANTLELIEAFGGMMSSGGFRVKARASLLYDVINRVTYDFQVMAYEVAERFGLFAHIPALPKNSVILLDQGYIDFEVLSFIHQNGHDFCLRVNDKINIVKALNKVKKRDGVYFWEPTKEAVVKCNLHNISIEPLKVRVIRIDSKKYDKPLYLVTTLLSTELYPKREFCKLYHKRWLVEEALKLKKVWGELENFTGFSEEIILQDIHAKVFSQNLVEVFAGCHHKKIEAKSKRCKNDYKVNAKAALSKSKDVIFACIMVYDNFKELLRKLIDSVFNDLLPVRPGRSFPREKKGKNEKRKFGFFMRYKRAK